MNGLHNPSNMLSEIDPLSEIVHIRKKNFSSFQSLQGLPSKMPNLKRFFCENISLSSLEGFPKYVPKLKEIFIRNTHLTSLIGLPDKIPELTEFRCDSSRLLSLRDFPSHTPKLTRISVCNNALSSLQGLPPLLHLPKRYSDQIAISDNFLENLAGLPFTCGMNDNFEGRFEYNDSPCVYLKGNPFRSLHGIPRHLYYSFLKHFDDRFAPVEHPTYLEELAPQPSEGISVFFYELYTMPTRNFHLSRHGFNLLFACLHESGQFWGEDVQFGIDNLNWEPYLVNWGRLNLPPREIFSDSWHRVHDALFDYYRDTPLELTSQYVAHRNSSIAMSEHAIGRLKHEGGPNERTLLEHSLDNPQNDPVIQEIQNRLSVSLLDGNSLLL